MKRLNKETIERYNLKNILSIRDYQGKDRCIIETIKDRQYFDGIMENHYKHVLNTLKEIGIKFVKAKILMINSYYNIIYYNIAFIGHIEYVTYTNTNPEWLRFNIKGTTIKSPQIYSDYKSFIKKTGRIISSV